DQEIQEILYRTSEIFAPFDVRVMRKFGDGQYDQGNSGNTTVFVGANSANQSRPIIHIPGTPLILTKYAYSVTFGDNVDYPGASTTNDIYHKPNSNPYDRDFVDPVYQDPARPKAGRAGWINTSTPTAISQSIAHEAGHTFGLAHVRTDKLR